MARKSRVAGNVIDTIPAKKGIYCTGIYARLSSEDKEEDTLENQIYLLKSHVESQTDMLLTDTYVGNGFSGTTENSTVLSLRIYHDLAGIILRQETISKMYFHS